MSDLSRREFIKTGGAGCAALAGTAALSGICCTGREQSESKKPNVLIMMCDQLNANALSCYGGPVSTPNIDRIAGSGALFSNATCPVPYCSPSRASMVTGMYAHTHGIVYNVNKNCEGIHPGDITTEGILNDKGYSTYHFGKWHLHDEELPYYPVYYRPQHHGREMKDVFEEAAKLPPDKKMNFYGHEWPVDVSPKVKAAVDKLGDKWDGKIYADFIKKMGHLRLPPERTFDVRFADEAVKRLETHGDNPFMLTCSFIWPHDPNFVPSPYYEMFSPGDIVLPENHDIREPRFENDWSRRAMADLNEDALLEFLRIYYATVKLVDDQVGKILATLDAQGKTDETIIVFTADHGDMMGGHGMVWKSTSSFYDEIVNIPMIIRYPEKIRPQKTELAACQTNVMPTLLELTGNSVPAGAQGHSLAPYLSGEKNVSEAPAYTFSERIRAKEGHRRGVDSGTKGNFMVRGKGWKYARYSDGEEYMYNLKEDPGETRNLAPEKSQYDQLEILRNELDAWLKRTGYPV